MPTRTIADREQWLAARLELLEAEKALTRQGDEVTRQRLALPWVPLEKEYRFDTDDGPASLAELFGGRSQLLVYHLMFGPDFERPCPSCSAIADGFNGIAAHLENHDVGLVAVSRAPLAMLQDYKRHAGWAFRWASSAGDEFNYDFSSSITEAEQASGTVEYNYRDADTTWVRDPDAGGMAKTHAAMAGTDTATFVRERPGMSAFAMDDDTVFHTYSTYARGLDALWGMYQWLDRAPLGRNESEPWVSHKDRYPPR